MQNWEVNLLRFQELLSSPVGIAGMLMLGVLAVLAVTNDKFRWLTLALLLWSLTLVPPIMAELDRPLIFPFQAIRDYARSIMYVLLLILAFATILTPRHSLQKIAPAVWAFFGFQLLIVVLMFAFAEPMRAALGAVAVVLTFLVMAEGTGRWAVGDKGRRNLIVAVGLAAGLVALVNALQLIVDRHAVTRHSRLYGTMGNPQHIALVLGTLFPTVIFLIISKAGRLHTRLLAGLTATVLIICVAWSGSRTGALMCVVSAIILVRLRLGKGLIAAVLLGGMGYAGFSFFSDSSDAAARLFSGQDTRSGAWQMMIFSFLESPLLGGSRHKYSESASENSFLYVAAEYGLIGLVPLLTAVLMISYMLARFLVLRTHLQGDDRLAIDLVVATFAGAFVGSLFEGVLLAQFSLTIYVCFAYAAIGVHLKSAAEGNAFAGGYDQHAYARPHPQVIN